MGTGLISESGKLREWVLIDNRWYMILGTGRKYITVRSFWSRQVFTVNKSFVLGYQLV